MIALTDHIHQMDLRRNELTLPEFPQSIAWFNTSPLSLSGALRSRLVLLHFWNYSSAKNANLIPKLKDLAQRWQHTPFTLLGIHSPKLVNEQDLELVRQAILRNDVDYAIAHDTEKEILQSLNIDPAPSYVLLGPTNNVLYSIDNENQLPLMESAIKAAMDFYGNDEFNHLDLNLDLEKNKQSHNLTLNFPGKIAIDTASERLFISDSHAHSILILSFNGQILERIGQKIASYKDGLFDNALFSNPQGLVFDANKLLVADVGNCCIRCIDFSTRSVSTIPIKFNSQTPWDLAYRAGELFIAMADSNQIGQYSAHNQQLKIFDHAWAQPSSICLGTNNLFVADSYNGCIKSVDLTTYQIETLCGCSGANPYNLFQFGDQEGLIDKNVLQNPCSIIYIPKNHSLIIADTFNHRIKSLDLKTKVMRTIAGNGKAGFRDGIAMDCQFNEPSGLALSADQRRIYVTDTNNHAIRLVDIVSKSATTLHLSLP
ncbi:MAG: hypothetical protein JHC93_01370 [Parachlamydiales bacterium]|nr:hypothetical protein [Parachlamydiales bacterium]